MTAPAPPTSAASPALAAGSILRVDDPIVDVEFDPASLPPVGTALRLSAGVSAPDSTQAWDLFAEIVAHEDGRIARAVLLGPTVGLARGQPAFATGAPLAFPVGDAVCGRVLDPLGAPLDGGPALVPEVPRRPLRPTTARAETTVFVAPPRAPRTMETGIRAIDLLAPLVHGGAIGVLGGAGTGRTRMLVELSLRARGAERVVFANVAGRASEALGVYDWWRWERDRDGTAWMDRSVIVHGGMAEPAGLRALAAHAGLAAAQAFCDAGHDTLLLLDDAWRAAQAETEIAAALRRPSDVGAGFAALRDASTRRAATTTTAAHTGAPAAALTTIEAILLPADDPGDPGVVDLLDALDVRLSLSRAGASRGLGPVLDPLACHSVALAPGVVGARHARIATQVRAALHRGDELEPTARMWGLDDLEPEARAAYRRARRIARYLVQPLYSVERLTGRDGAYCPLDATLDDFERILAGELDALPERCFELARDLAEVRARAAALDRG